MKPRKQGKDSLFRLLVYPYDNDCYSFSEDKPVCFESLEINNLNKTNSTFKEYIKMYNWQMSHYMMHFTRQLYRECMHA